MVRMISDSQKELRECVVYISLDPSLHGENRKNLHKF